MPTDDDKPSSGRADEPSRSRTPLHMPAVRPHSGVDSWGVYTWSEGLTTEASIQLVMPDRKETPFFLRQITGPGAPRDWNLIRDEVIVGRSKGADFSIDSPELSRQHIKFVREGKEYKCIDLESRNGLYLDGVRIHSVMMRQGDVIQIGNVSFVFIEGA